MVTIKVSFDDVSKNSAKPVECKCREVPMTGVDCGDEVAEWLTKVIGKANLRLVYSGPGLKKRDVLERAKNVTLAKSGNLVAYPDYTPYHLATDDSLADLNNKAQHPVAMDNFRANIIVKATDPFEEDYWREVRIGEATFQNVRLTTRCKLTQIDPKNGEPDNVTKDPINTLRKYRRFKKLGDSPCFGINLTINQTGPIKVGDEVFATRHALRACCES
ncbi:unnamed protein product [Owenia fusiformis]|uniref:Uncharacterized protein n=1 Tax=Owenia fusiformis TaxID=6347 RepID=A0A8J1TJC9_OWEFU|nr:unnamed protein product [Owenia fusiformis]